MKLGEHSVGFHVLDASERVQDALYKVVGPEFGARAVALFTGADSPAYRQAIWLPRKSITHANPESSITVPASAGRQGLPARRMAQCAVLSVESNELMIMKHIRVGSQEAIMYEDEGEARVGILWGQKYAIASRGRSG
jgi:hypothetical protein